MSSEGRGDRVAHRLAFCAGVGLMALAVVAWRMPGGSGQPGLDLRVRALAAGELAVSRTSPFVAGTAMRPGGPAGRASGTVTVTNQTGRRLAVRLRALPSSRDLDRALALRVTAGGAPLYRGPLGGLRRPTARAFRLGRGERRTLALAAWLPAGAGGWQGRIEDVSLEFAVRPAGR